MSRYRRVYPAMWRTPAFSGLDATAQRLALYVLSGPQSTPTGIGPFSAGQAAEDLGIELSEARSALTDACAAMGWQFDAGARVLWLPLFWRENAPTSPNTLKSVLKTLVNVPPCDLLDAFRANRGDIPPGCLATFDAMVGNSPTPNPPGSTPPSTPRSTASSTTPSNLEPQRAESRDQRTEVQEERDARATCARSAPDSYPGGDVLPAIRGRAFTVITENTRTSPEQACDLLDAVDATLKLTGELLPFERVPMLRRIDDLVAAEQTRRRSACTTSAGVLRTETYLDRQQREAEEAIAACEAEPSPFGHRVQ